MIVTKGFYGCVLVTMLCVCTGSMFCGASNDWGFFAHRGINRRAVFALPPPLIGFYKKNIESIVQRAVAPDLRRHSVKDEAAKHYIDLDYYEDSIRFNMPTKWSDAVAVFGETHLKEHGIVPYNVQKVYWQLVNAWKNRAVQEVLKLSADLGHYVGDANVPLHTTANYDGQYTHQEGIHAFWETTIPTTYFDQFDLWFGEAQYIIRVDSVIWANVYKAHRRVPKVLLTEQKISQLLGSDSYQFVKKKHSVSKSYSTRFVKKYYRAMDGMVEDAFRQSAYVTACLWYSAWIEGGQPTI